MTQCRTGGISVQCGARRDRGQKHDMAWKWRGESQERLQGRVTGRAGCPFTWTPTAQNGSQSESWMEERNAARSVHSPETVQCLASAVAPCSTSRPRPTSTPCTSTDASMVSGCRIAFSGWKQAAKAGHIEVAEATGAFEKYHQVRWTRWHGGWYTTTCQMEKETFRLRPCSGCGQFLDKGGLVGRVVD